MNAEQPRVGGEDGPMANNIRLPFNQQPEERQEVVILHGDCFVATVMVIYQGQGTVIHGSVTSIEPFVPEHMQYFSRNREAKLIQFKLRQEWDQYKNELVVLETIRDRGITDGFPTLVSSLENDLENIAEIMIIQQGICIFKHFRLDRL